MNRDQSEHPAGLDATQQDAELLAEAVPTVPTVSMEPSPSPSPSSNPSLSLSSLPTWFTQSFQLRPDPQEHQGLLKLLVRFAQGLRFSHSQIEQLCKMAKDLSDWSESASLKDFLRQQLSAFRMEQSRQAQPSHSGKAAPQRRKQALGELASFYQAKQQRLPNYQRSHPKPKVPKYHFEVLGEPEGPRSACAPSPATKPSGASQPSGERILGSCPVASLKTRCCNLLTLDAIQQCGFGCSYCAIQHFYGQKSIQVRKDFGQKLKQLQLDPERWYHIGTGQASDSLLWAEDLGVLQPLIEFARRYPRVILELKSKSANVQSLLAQDLPPNMLFTWSLNPQSFIQHEELLTAPLDARLRAARLLADKGAKVGFHFHPIVRYQGWKSEYSQLGQCLSGLFRPEEVATVSLGTLTFAKSALKTIRHKAEQTQILRFAMQEVAGKFSYAHEVKRELFCHVYQSLAPWHGKVFFYLCMEDPTLWPQVFGIFGQQYASNQDFEHDMLLSYRRKMGLH